MAAHYSPHQFSNNLGFFSIILLRLLEVQATERYIRVSQTFLFDQEYSKVSIWMRRKVPNGWRLRRLADCA